MKLSRNNPNIIKFIQILRIPRMFLMIMMLFLISGCGAKTEKKIVDDGWKNEVLMMDECGSDGLKCCVDQDPSCSFGQTCCVDPNNSTETYCALECSFGDLDEYCLDDNECNGTLVCARGRCGECGVAGNTCCEGEKKCLASESSENNRTQCVDNVCASCGYAGKKICNSESVCNPNHFENNSVCLSCGGFNQPCCQSEEGEKCFDSDLKCDLGFCVK